MAFRHARQGLRRLPWHLHGWHPLALHSIAGNFFPEWEASAKSTELTIYCQLAAIRASMQAFQEYSAGLTQQHRNEFARLVRAREFDNQSEMVAYLKRCRAVIAEAEAEWKLLQVWLVAGAGFEPAAFRL
ncbi:hypothetical protein RRU01S_23_02000 [Agrobacterium rubi TR3 = NBRC 13261]|uniref:Uncharacterized protein n=1 Tax=Agrobacterium rubi TR3 = NBRC 13261 TaxID=1368415 RepID=A0A081CZM8_9HYPH|nr:hypothetical protein RRU01S_23_02000 [Agrobacterium rubi TR3 = NBRC 13261]